MNFIAHKKYYKGINSNLFIKNDINYMPICTFNVCKSYNDYIKREIAGDTYLFVHISLYRLLPLLFQRWLYQGKLLYSSQECFCRLIYKDSPSIGFSRWLSSVLAFTLTMKRLKTISLLQCSLMLPLRSP